jgi:hypothetical protein
MALAPAGWKLLNPQSRRERLKGGEGERKKKSFQSTLTEQKEGENPLFPHYIMITSKNKLWL